VGTQFSAGFMAALLPQRTNCISQFFPFDQFQIALLPDWNAIKLALKVGIIPVGAGHFTK